MKTYQIICHMMTSIDGRVSGDFLNAPSFGPYGKKYYELMQEPEMRAWICGRKTFEESFTYGHKADVTAFANQKVARTDYIANPDAKTLAIAVDPSGKLGWTYNTIGDDFEERKGDHIVTILSEAVDDAYLAYLQKLGISYIFAGPEKPLSMKTAMDKINNYFGINIFLLTGGGIIDGAFATENLIDEYSLIMVPMIEGTANSVSLVETPWINHSLAQEYKLTQNDRVGDHGLWLRFKK